MIRRTRADFSKPPQPIGALAPNVGSLGEHRVALAATPRRAWDARVARRQKTFTFVPGKLAQCHSNAHPVVKAVGLAVLVRSAGPKTQNASARELEVHFRLPGWFGESHPTSLEQHRDDSTSSPDRLVAGDLLHL